MRLWTLHPKHLDTKGLVALWRETLLAKKVLEGKTKGYTNHPQLDRFKQQKEPLQAINFYLKHLWLEAKRRNFNFNKEKFIEVSEPKQIPVTDGQINFETQHLLQKLKTRAPEQSLELLSSTITLHPLFYAIEGEIEDWEIR